jgi:hypothetical protein
MLWRSMKSLCIPWKPKTTEAQNQQIMEHWLGEAIDRAPAKP